MYEDKLGTGWEDLSGEEAIRRAYALGVAASFGYENDEEFERLRVAPGSSYDRSIIELAYREGRREAEVVRADSGADSDEAVWSRLVEGSHPADRVGDGDGDAASDGPVATTGLPAALDRAGFLSGGADLDALGFPDLFGSPPTGGDGPEP